MKKVFDDFFQLFRKKHVAEIPENSISQSDNFEDLEKLIGYTFENRSILITALTHSSCYRTNSSETSAPSNYERMEFLGDAILGLVAAEHLYCQYPDRSEGFLTKLKSKVVSENFLSAKANSIKLGQYVIMGKEEYKSGGFKKKSILANMTESLICAIYLDGGFEQAKEFVVKFLLEGYETEIKSEVHINFKSILQEHFQSKQQKIPTYTLLKTAGPDHQKVFSIEVSFNEETLGVGQGLSKKAAEQAAARDACKKLGIK